MAESKVMMNLCVDTRSNKVLFAEADKDCVDFLFHLLSLPIATVIRLVTKPEMPGSLANLYESIENLNEEYMQPNQDKDSLLKPISVARESGSAPLLRLNDEMSKMTLYKCNCDIMTYVSGDTRAVCPRCGQIINLEATYVAPPNPLVGQGGYVKGVVKYLVMDDLVVKPSIISGIRLFKQLGVNDVSVLQGKQVNLGSVEAVKILKTSLHSKNVLTEVFLRQG